MTFLGTWREQQGFTLKQAGEHFGFGGRNPARTYQRIESGETAADAITAERVVRLTGGVVTVQDLHETRLAWLRARGRSAE